MISQGLEELGLEVITPQQRERRSGNTCFLDSNAEETRKLLEKQSVLIWGEYGRVRVSGHLYNTSADVSRLLDALRQVREQG